MDAAPTSADAPAGPQPRTHRAAFLALLLIFFLSGAAGLIYQVVWTRRLFLTLGATSLAISTILTAFMTGLALGSLVAGRFADRRRNPLLLYAALELAIAFYGAMTPFLFDAAEDVFHAVLRRVDLPLWPSLLLRFGLAMVILIVPTSLMGATLPVLSKHIVESLGHFGRRIGLLYALNTFGAAFGVVLSGFLLIPGFGITATIDAAVLLNVLVAAAAWGLDKALRSPRSEVQSPASEVQGPPSVPAPIPAADSSPAPTLEPGPRNPPPANASPPVPTLDFGHGTSDPSDTSHRWVLLIAGLGGFASFLYEIAWTRVLTLVLGGAVQAFSVMLTTFLIGLALGSFVLSRLIDRSRDLFMLFATIEALVGITSLLLLPYFGELPGLYVRFFAGVSDDYTHLTLFNFAICFLMMIVPTFLIGVTFPVVSRLYARDLGSLGRRVGEVYFANTLGGIFGSFLGGWLFITHLGMEWTCIAAALINAACAMIAARLGSSSPGRKTSLATATAVATLLLVFAYPLAWPRGRHEIRILPTVGGHPDAPPGWSRPELGRCAKCGVEVWTDEAGRFDAANRRALPLCDACAPGERKRLDAEWIDECAIAPRWFWDPRLITSGVHTYAKALSASPGGALLRASIDEHQLRFYEEGLNAVVTVHEMKKYRKIFSLQVNGKTDASNADDFPTEVLLGALPMLMHPDPRDVMVIGLGSGITAGTVSRYDTVRSIDQVEIEPAVIRGAVWFAEDNHFVLPDAKQNHPGDPKLRLIQEDARHYCVITPRRYDVIISEPSNPWMSGPSHLFTREHFRNLQRVMRDDGITMQWFHTYSMSPEVVLSVVRMFRESFPHMLVIAYPRTVGDFYLIGANHPIAINVNRIRERMLRPAVRRDLERVGFPTPAHLLAGLMLREEDWDRNLKEGPREHPEVLSFLQQIPENTDDFPFVEFEAPRFLHTESSLDVIRTFFTYRHLPWPPLAPDTDETLRAMDLCPKLAEANDFVGLSGATMQIAERGLAVNPADEVMRARLVDLYLARWRALPPEHGGDEALGQARAHLGRLLEINPKNGFAPGRLAEISLARKEYDEAIRMYQKVVATGVSGPKAWNNLGTAYARSGRNDEAIQAFDKAVLLDPGFSEAFDNLAFVHEKAGHFEKAIDTLMRWYRQEQNSALRVQVRQRLNALRERRDREGAGAPQPPMPEPVAPAGGDPGPRGAPAPGQP